MAKGFTFQTINLRVSDIGQRIYFKSESIIGYSKIAGLSLKIGHEGALYGSTFGFRVAEKEVLDESHECHLLTFSDNLAPSEKMLFFEKPIPVDVSKIEGIYTDSALQGLLENLSNNPGGGIISKNDINVVKTYVSGKDLMSFQTFAVDAGIVAYSGSISLIPPSSSIPIVYYPYDVRIRLLLLK